MRQFHQLNCENLGVAHPLADVEMLSLAADMLKALGVLDKTVLHLNSLGDLPSRLAYRDALVAYFSRYRNDLSDDSKARLERNPLRILDSKDVNDRKLLPDAPKLESSYTPEAADYFARVRVGLDALGITFTHDPALVRGLDYYAHTAFEFVTDQLGAQGTVLGGGRYDGLIGIMGGPETPAIGFAAGIERLSELVSAPKVSPTRVAVVAVSAQEELAALKVARALRAAGIIAELPLSGNLGKKMKKADKLGATHAAIIGADEAASGMVTLRCLARWKSANGAAG